MSISSFFGVSRCGLGLFLDVAGQVLVAAAAAAGVMAVAGCSARAAQPAVAMAPPPPVTPDPRVGSAALDGGISGGALSSALSSPANSTLLDPPAAAGQGNEIWSAPPRPGPGAAPAVGTSSMNGGSMTGGAGAQARPTPESVASAKERKRAQKAEVDAMLADAMVPPAGPAARGSVALRVADRAIAPLQDTLVAIDAAQRVVVENLRNVEVVAFKASRTACGDGRDVASQLDTAQGELQATHRVLDVAVQGEGFLQIQVYTPEKPAGTVGFTRNGRLYVAKDGTLVAGKPDGYKLIPPIAVPVGTTELKVEQDGTVKAAQAGADKPTPQVIGKLTLARFTDASALQPLGGGVYGESDSSGSAVESPAGERGTGVMMQGFIEAGNVDLIRERMRMRFLQGWRATVLAAMNGETDQAAANNEDGAAAAAGPRGQRSGNLK